MLYSKIFRPHLGLCRQPLLLLATLLLAAQLSIAQTNKLIGSDMRLPASAPDNSLIDTDTIAPPPPKLSPAEAAERVRAKVGGQVMSVSTQQRETGVIYGVKVLNAGRMRVINVDGETGQLLNH